MFKEWPLVAFTLAGQTAVGLFLLTAATFILIPVTPDYPMAAMRSWLLTSHGGVLVLLSGAALASFFHLRHPARARRVLTNIGTSRLSREILFLLAFAALVAGAMALVAANAAVDVVKGLQIAAGLAGALYLLSMTGLYMLVTLPVWRQAGTPICFVGSSLSLGAVALTALGGRLIFVPLAVLFVFLELAGSALFAPGYGLLARRPRPSLRPPQSPSRRLHGIGLGLEFSGLILLIAVLFSLNREWEGPVAVFAVSAAMILAGQAVRRFLFYGLLVQSGR